MSRARKKKVEMTGLPLGLWLPQRSVWEIDTGFPKRGKVLTKRGTSTDSSNSIATDFGAVPGLQLENNLPAEGVSSSK